jgi:hypothetical protein
LRELIDRLPDPDYTVLRNYTIQGQSFIPDDMGMAAALPTPDTVKPECE